MLGVLSLFAIVSATSAMLPYKLTECTNSPNKLISLGNISISNINPIRIPGNETVSLDLHILKAISGMHYKVELTIVKHALFGYVIVPCFDDISKNTCVFELCDILSGSHYASDPHRCPAEVASSSPDFNCACPFSPGTYHVNPTSFLIDNLPSYIKFLAQGDYKAHIKVTDTATNELVVCYDLQLSTGADCSGISCLIGRK